MTRIRAALFDMDGTIFDSKIDLGVVRRALGLPRDGRSFLEQLTDLPAEMQDKGMAMLVEAEARGAADGVLLPGAEEFVESLRTRGVRCALVTNNSRVSAETVLRRYPLPFDLVLTRDDGAAKPDPGIFSVALARLGATGLEALAIGDAHFDLLAAYRAGVAEIILLSPPSWVLDFIPEDIPHRRAADLREAQAIAESILGWRAGRPGCPVAEWR
jgi:HAD superfamily hydrolase (TIGR01509 family)